MGSTKTTSCCLCGKIFPAYELVILHDKTVCGACQPRALLKIKEGVFMKSTEPFGGAYRDRKLVLTRNQTRLPKRCVKCNVATEDKFTLKLSWHHWVFYMFLFLGVLPHLIILPLVTKRAIVEVGLCERHRKRRLIDMRASLTGIFLGGVIMVVGLSCQRLELGLAGVLLIFAGFVYLIDRSIVLAPKRIDSVGRVWLTGACRQYLESLPSANG